MKTNILLVSNPITKEELKNVASQRFGDLVKAVVDIDKGIMTIGSELHVDGEEFLLEQGSKQKDLWGINIYPDLSKDKMLEFDSMINIRPRQNNRSRSVEDLDIQKRIFEIVNKLIQI